jgi:hypothetical protein
MRTVQSCGATFSTKADSARIDAEPPTIPSSIVPVVSISTLSDFGDGLDDDALFLRECGFESSVADRRHETSCMVRM